jgi:hypothetical protein
MTNTKTAKTIGITIPQSLLMRAEVVSMITTATRVV